MSPALIAIAAEVGAPLIERVLAGRIGGKNAALARDVVGVIAEHAGILPEDVEHVAQAEPERIRTAMQEIEGSMPGTLEIYEAELDAKREILAAEKTEPLWARAWRPLGMYGLGFLWLWNLVFLHVANAVWKIALPPTDLSVLMQISVLYMSLYMGGHTVKDVVSKWAGRI